MEPLIRKAQPLFVGGTASNVGKSWMVTAICASLRRRGVRVAPFKAQNMSNHSYPCAEGGEIGRAQVAQAHACGLEPEVAMNPILLKPNSDGTSQVVLRGKVWKTLPARRYYEHHRELLNHVLEAYTDLASRFDVIVIEGAGSVSELNLRAFDLVNLALVTRLSAPWVLVADIERGGVFASIVGTVELLTPAERALFRGFLVNKFRGDVSLFDGGRQILEDRTRVPCLGVFPCAGDLRVDAEDSLALDQAVRTPAPARAAMAIIRFPMLSNGTDFRRLTWADWITQRPTGSYDFVILPGTKNTISDLLWMRERGLDTWVREQHQRGATIIGICGGFQMLGETVRDPGAVESAETSGTGLGMLPVRTRLAAEKVTRLRRATTPGGRAFSAYEIHLGETVSSEPLSPFAWLENGEGEGARKDRVIGTYLHGAIEDAGVCRELFGIDLPEGPSRTEEFDALADWFDQYAERTDEWLP